MADEKKPIPCPRCEGTGEVDPEPSDQPVTIKLRKPVVLGSETITEVTVRPATGKDFRGLPEKDRGLKLAGRLTGQSDAFIDKLESRDLKEVMAVVQDFA